MNIIEMKDGSIVNAENVVAIRKRKELPEIELGPAVIVDFTVGNHGMCLINECIDEHEQNALMRKYKDALGI